MAPIDAGPQGERDPIPHRLRVLAEWSWRLLVIAAAIVAVLFVLGQLRLVVVPLVASLFIAAVLAPVMVQLRRLGAPPALAAIASLILGLAVLGGVGYLIVDPLTGQFDDLIEVADDGRADVLDFLDRELGISRADVDDAIDDAIDSITENRDVIVGGIVSGAQLVLLMIAGSVLMIVFAFFFLKDGPAIWDWITERVPDRHRPRVTEAGEAAWSTLGSYLRGLSMIATFDAVMFALVMLAFGIPFVLPIALLAFALAFIPYVGAITSVAVVSLVALFSEDLVVALLVLAATTAVQQVDGNVITPIVMRRAVLLHPIVVLAALGAGAVTAGILGALLAVPVVAVLSIALPILFRHDEDQREGAEPSDGDVRGDGPPARHGPATEQA